MEEKINRKNLLKSTLAGILIGGLAGLVGLAGCDFKKNETKTDQKQEFTLRVSESTIKPTTISYCGMPPDEKWFSLAYYGNSAINYYYPKDSRQIYFRGFYYNVISVDANQITLKPVQKEKSK